MGEIFQVMSIIIAVLSLIFGVGYFVVGKLIDRSHNLRDQLEKAKHSHLESEISHVKEVFGGFVGEVKEFRSILYRWVEETRKIQSSMSEASHQNKMLQERIDTFVTDVKSRIDSLENGKMIPIGDGHFIIKGAKK